MVTILTLTGEFSGVPVALAGIYLNGLRRLSKVSGKTVHRHLAEDLHIAR